jgi:glycine dehydrogenase subunit 1
MALRLTHRDKIIVSTLIHPHYRETIKTYLAPHGIEVIELPFLDGLVAIEQLEKVLDDTIAAVLIQNPNFLGGIEDLGKIAEMTHEKKALFIDIITESMSLGILAAPGDAEVDIIAGSAQSFGMDLNFGGPYNAFLATRKQYIRQIPGRIAGETKDKDGKRAFVMTFRAREQDIRREKATSNICTNHNLNVIASNIYLSLMGTEGIYQYSLLNSRMAHYLENRLMETGKFEKVFQYPYYNEFLLRYKGEISELEQTLITNHFIPPLSVQSFYPDKNLENTLLFAVTEIFNRNELNHITDILS